MPRVVIVDDDPLILASWQAALADRFEVSTFRLPREAERHFVKERVDVALLDFQLPGSDGLSLLRRLKQLQPSAEVVIMTGHGSIQLAVEATRAGAFDFLTKPVEDPAAVALRLEAALERKRLSDDNAALRTRLSALGPATELIGESEPMQKLRTLVGRVAASDAPTLILGESGTGKELVARALHAQGPRRDKPFLPVNCAAVSESLIDSELFGHERGAFTGAATSHKGLFEAAHEGSLFLDEIGDVPLSTQVRLLRALQEGEIRPVGATRSRHVDVRVIAATNVDLARAMAEGRFRHDLFYRLSAFRIELPALRQRGHDVELLVAHMLERGRLRGEGRAEGVTPEALAVLARYPFPGNVRELSNVIRYAFALCDGPLIEVSHLPPYLAAYLAEAGTPAPAAGPAAGAAEPVQLLDDLSYRVARDRFERRYIQELLRVSGANLSEASRRSGVDRSNLRRMLRRLGVALDGTTVPPEPGEGAGEGSED
jgi:two-component system response regulator HydG